MKGIFSFSLRCLNALLWSLGLSSVVMVLMIGFYICWTIPVVKEEKARLSAKASKPKTEAKAHLFMFNKNAVYADR